MHNLHFLRINGCDSHEDAQLTAMHEIESFGHEDNYRSCVGSICKSDDSYQINDATDARWQDNPWDSARIIELLHDELVEFNIKPFNDNELLAIYNGINTNSTDIYRAHKYFERKTNVDSLESINIWQDTMYDWSLDEVGLTNLCYSTDDEYYIVIIDMHS